MLLLMVFFFMFSWAKKMFKNIADRENIFGMQWNIFLLKKLQNKFILFSFYEFSWFLFLELKCFFKKMLVILSRKIDSLSYLNIPLTQGITHGVHASACRHKKRFGIMKTFGCHCSCTSGILGISGILLTDQKRIGRIQEDFCCSREVFQ